MLQEACRSPKTIFHLHIGAIVACTSCLAALSAERQLVSRHLYAAKYRRDFSNRPFRETSGSAVSNYCPRLIKDVEVGVDFCGSVK